MLSFSVGSVMDRDDLFAELYFENFPLGEVSLSDDRKTLNLVIYPTAKENIFFKFDYLEFITFLEKAKKRLLEIEGIKSYQYVECKNT